jgi:phenylpropionate dioxygenase-like ring-hydroxylating dioxygenase large terminal subunit
MTTTANAPAYETPTYNTAIKLVGAATEFDSPDPVRRDAGDLVRRLVEHFRNTTTDEAPDQWSEPVHNYLDEDLFKREMQHIHHKVPLALAMSAELRGPGSYKAVEVAGIPVLITRDKEGAIHAAINACRHRGAELLPEGTGTTKRIVCPYHSWTYDLSGCLVGIYGEKTFGPVDKGKLGLISLPAEERAGIVFVGLTPGRPLDLDNWLGELGPLLDGLRLESCHHHSTRSLDGPNWKVALDGYLESYHFASLHRTTVFVTNYSNMAAFDSWGPHIRVAFALRPMAEAVKQPPETWDPGAITGPIYYVFPGLAISGGWRETTAVSFIMPGRTMKETNTQQVLLLRQPPSDQEASKAADGVRDWFRDVVYDEDYATTCGQQRGLQALDGTNYLFGRNEPGVQHFHRTVNALMADGAE